MIALRVLPEGHGQAYDCCFDKDEVLVGRSDRTDLPLPHAAVSLFHLRLRREGERVWVTDLDSANGSWIDGERLVPQRPRPLPEGGRIVLASARPGAASGHFVVELLDAPAAPGEDTVPQTTASFARQMVCRVIEGLAPTVAPCRLQVVRGPNRGRCLDLVPRPRAYTVGRDAGCDLALTDADASRVHLELTATEGGVSARDPGSKNGVKVNGVPCTAPFWPLRDGDELQIGQSRLRFSDPVDGHLVALQQDGAAAQASATLPSDPPEQEAAQVRRGVLRRQRDLLLWTTVGLLVSGALGLIGYLLFC